MSEVKEIFDPAAAPSIRGGFDPARVVISKAVARKLTPALQEVAPTCLTKARTILAQNPQLKRQPSLALVVKLPHSIDCDVAEPEISDDAEVAGVFNDETRNMPSTDWALVLLMQMNTTTYQVVHVAGIPAEGLQEGQYRPPAAGMYSRAELERILAEQAKMRGEENLSETRPKKPVYALTPSPKSARRERKRRKH